MAWSATLTKLEKYDEGVNVTVTIANGLGYSVDVTRPVFRPTSKADVVTAVKNIIAEFKARKAAQAVVDTLVSNMAGDVGTSIGE